jgi:hypothetical protein
MEVYGKQVEPLLQVILQAGGVQNIYPEENYFQRAVSRAMLSRWPELILRQFGARQGALEVAAVRVTYSYGRVSSTSISGSSWRA